MSRLHPGAVQQMVRYILNMIFLHKIKCDVRGYILGAFKEIKVSIFIYCIISFLLTILCLHQLFMLLPIYKFILILHTFLRYDVFIYGNCILISHNISAHH